MALPARGLLPLGALVALALLMPGAAHAQPNDVMLRFKPGAVIFSSPGVPEFLTGWVDFSALTVTVQPRGPGSQQQQWDLYIRAANPDLGGYGKPLPDLLWRLDGSPTWTPLTATEQFVTGGQGRTDVVVHFRMLLDLSRDVPGTYQTPVVFTAEER